MAPRGWTLDLDRLLAALTPDTRMLMINSPNNPTGWTMTREEQRTVLDALPPARHLDRRRRSLRAPVLRRRRARRAFVSRSRRARRTRDRGEFVLEGVADDGLAARLDRCADAADGRSRQARRIQHVVRAVVRPAGGHRRGGRGRALHAVARRRSAREPRSSGEGVADDRRRRRARAATARCICSSRCRARERSLELCKSLVREAGLGLAPGSAFGPEGEGFVRWCYACDPARLDAGVERLRRFLAARGVA